MEFFKKKTSFDFFGYRKIALMFSLLLVGISIISLCTKGINWGLDFTGGTVAELTYPASADLDDIRQRLHQNGFEEAIVQYYGSTHDVIVRIAPRVGQNEQVVAQALLKVLQQTSPEVHLLRAETVGAQVGQELAQKGTLAVLLALFLIACYIGFRFEYRFAVSAAVALAHDPIIILGVFSLWGLEFDLNTLAAILAILGYSLNDTIVVFDRVKENFIRVRKGTPLEIMNLSINQTLSRTIMTSALTLMVVLALLIFGGPTIFGFALALFIGIVVGTYSSIYVAGSCAVALGLNKQDLMLPAKTQDEA